MPKVHGKRSHRSAPNRQRPRLKFTFVHFAFVTVIAGILVVWLISPFSPFNRAQTYRVVGPPTISADFINRVLDYYHSPARGKGQTLYDDGVKYGIDPVYALAFFMHESSFGTTGVARYTHSLGNIRTTSGYQDYHGYRLYKTWEEGFEDWYKLITNQYIAQWGLTTVDQIVPVYAPSSDNNDVAAYIQAIENAVDAWRSGIVEV